MSEIIGTSQWVQFFKKAGLPSNVAANYAIIFTDNRIKLNMLLDLTKEYLFDMGIRVMGDVIAILRYAKDFHSEVIKEKKIMNKPPSRNVIDGILGYSQSPVVQKTTVIQNRTIQAAKKSSVISLKRTAVQGPYSVKKVSPEDEGAYKIKMPSGTTERTRRILQQQQIIRRVPAIRSVFDRLGESAVSSSTDSKGTSVFRRLGGINKITLDDVPTSTSVDESGESLRNNRPLQYRGVLKNTMVGKKTVTTMEPKNGTEVLRRTVINTTVSRPSTSIMKTINMNRINSILLENKDSGAQMKRIERLSASQGILGKRIGSAGSDVRSRLGVKAATKVITTNKRKLKAKNRIVLGKTPSVFDRLGN